MGCGCRDRPPHQLAGEADDPGRAADVFQAPRNLLVLDSQAVRREDGVGLGLPLVTQGVHEARQLGEPCSAGRTIAQVFRGRGIDRVTVLFDKITVEQAIFPEVMRATDHGLPPNNPRSLRAARNR